MNVNTKAIQSFAPKINLQRAKPEQNQIPNPNFGEPHEKAYLSISDSQGRGFSDNFGEPHMPADHNSRQRPEALTSPSRHITLGEEKATEPSVEPAAKTETAPPPSQETELNPLAGEPYQPNYLIADAQVTKQSTYQGYS